MDDAVPSVADKILEDMRQVQLVIQENQLFPSAINGQLKKLFHAVSAVKNTLEALEEGRYSTAERFKVERCLRKIKDALYDAEDELNEALSWKIEKSMTKKVRSFFSRSNPLAYSLKTSRRIQRIRKTLHDIIKNISIPIELGSSHRVDIIKNIRIPIELRSSHRARPVEYYSRERETQFFSTEVVLGRDRDKESIVKLLMDFGSHDAESMCVISILGRSGIGKTTLSRLVCNDDRIKYHFDALIWVDVSFNFDLKRIVQTILASLSISLVTKKKILASLSTRTQGADLPMETLLRHIRVELDGKRFLLVLDDVTADIDIDFGRSWAELKTVLMRGQRGSKILVTTRFRSVDVAMGTISPYNLPGLPENDSWELLKQRAFVQGLGSPALEEIGRQIVRKCEGVPLALIAVGGILKSESSEAEWERVRDEAVLTRNGMSILYNSLPLSQLKHCFAYCSLFPKGFPIPKEMLINLWMAQGFLQSSDHPDLSNLSMEDIGNCYFNYLLSRSFFRDVQENDYGNIVSCKMRDLHYYAQSISSRRECLIVNNAYTPIEDSVRHMFLLCDTYQGLFASRKLRTFLSEARVEVFHDLRSSTLRYIRALRLRSSNTQELLRFVSELKPLRYLDLSGNSMKTLPESITQLQNLQTLIVRQCGIEELPIHTGEMESLRHIDLSNNYLIKVPKSICKLKNLQSLTLRSCEELEELPMNIGEMVNLRQIDVSGSRKIKMLPESINELKNLKSLVLNDCDELEALPKDIGNMVSLRQLQVDWFKNSIRIPSAVGKLTNLQKLPLFTVSKEEEDSKLRILHGLNNLRGVLKIRNLENATTLDAMEANLKEKQHLESLILEWKFGGVDGTDDVAFLNALQPPQNLKKLTIDGYNGASFSPWMTNVIHFTFPHLVRVDLRNCRRCYCLPSLCQLPSLASLSLCNLKALEYVKNHAASTERGEFFPSLKKLELRDLYRLKEWSRIEETEHVDDGATAAKTGPKAKQQQLTLLSFPCLFELTVRRCPELKAMPSSPSIKHLKLENFSAELLQSLMTVDAPENWPSLASSSLSSIFPLGKLTSLDICSCYDLLSFPEEGLRALTSLRSLSIDLCHSLTSLPEEGLRGLTSLETLSIRRCNSLLSLSPGMQYLTALNTLSIKDCKDLDLLMEDGLHGLRNLRTLTIEYLPKLLSLPEGLQHATNLQSLKISDCQHLMTLPEWLGRLSSIEYFAIIYCPDLSSLPQGMTMLMALKELEVCDCEKLNLLEDDGLRGLWNLRDVKISGLPNLVYLPEGLRIARNLQSLKISHCEGLMNLPEWLGDFPFLKQLCIEDCRNVQSLPQGMPDLKKLRISRCPHLSSLPQPLGALEELEICDCEKLNLLKDNGLHGLRRLRAVRISRLPYLPAGLQSAEYLRSLKISHCEGLMNLPEWLGNIPSLEQLCIEDCRNVQSLPRRMPDLKKLRISQCPHLSRRCERRTGEDWPKISHIRDVSVDDGLHSSQRHSSELRLPELV